jgi:hypothetical protein
MVCQHLNTPVPPIANREMHEFWSAVAERSGDTALGRWPTVQKRHGASLPAAVQKV